MFIFLGFQSFEVLKNKTVSYQSALVFKPKCLSALKSIKKHELQLIHNKLEMKPLNLIYFKFQIGRELEIFAELRDGAAGLFEGVQVGRNYSSRS